MQKKLDNKQKIYNTIKKEREKKQHKVSLMYSDNLDLDLLEEQARMSFNFIDNNEVVVEDKN